MGQAGMTNFGFGSGIIACLTPQYFIIMRGMERFENLVGFYGAVKTIASAICVEKGGIDIDNYAGRFFVADLLELIIAYGEKAGVSDLDGLRRELAARASDITPANKPIYEMSLEEFERFIGNGEAVSEENKRIRE